MTFIPLQINNRGQDTFKNELINILKKLLTGERELYLFEQIKKATFDECCVA